MERRAAVVAAALVQIGLLVGALADLRRRSATEINGSKAIWAGVSLVNFVGPIAYFLLGRRRNPPAT